jgi:hypothetical protein
VDADVFGWSKDFAEMGALGSEVKRFPRGKQRGEAFLLVFDIGSITPKHNVHVLYITQADMPHDPLPIDDVRERMWAIDYQYQNMWPRRPKRKWYRGAMKIETLSVLDKVQPTVCQPAVGFVMQYKGQWRYQPHQGMKIEAPCSNLRTSDVRTYWAKKDLGAVMIRFDYSPDASEQSIRIPLSAAWSLGESLRITLRTDRPRNHPATVRLLESLGRYGRVDLEVDGDATGPARVACDEEHRYAALQIAHDLGGELSAPIQTDDADAPEHRAHLVVRVGSGDEPAPDDSGATGGGAPTPARRPSSPGTPKDPPPRSEYLDDFAP